MILGQHGEEWFGAKGNQFQVFVTQREGENREVDRQIPQAFDQDRRRFFNDAQLRLRILLRKCRGVARHQVGRNGRDSAYGYAAANVGALIGYAGSRRLPLAQNGAGVGQKGATGFGEAHTAAQAVEELSAQIFLELENLLRERGLGNLAALCGAAETAGIRDGADVA